MEAPSSARSATSRRVVDVSSVEHAAAVIRALRSASHAQQNYHRSACRDDQILTGIDYFNGIVVKQAFQVVEKKKVDHLINIVPEKKSVSLQQVQKGKDVTCLKVGHEDDLSSDEDDNSPPQQTRDTDYDDRIRTTDCNGYPDDCSADMFTGNHKPSVRREGAYDSSDDDLLGGLGSDDEEDMAELLRGFVVPRISAPNQKAAAGHSGGMRDLDDGDGCSSPSMDVSKQVHSKSRPPNKSTHQSGTEGSRSVLAAAKSRSGDSAGLLSADTARSSILSGPRESTSASGGETSRHQVMVTPGQRIRVRPSRKHRPEHR